MITIRLNEYVIARDTRFKFIWHSNYLIHASIQDTICINQTCSYCICNTGVRCGDIRFFVGKKPHTYSRKAE